MAILARTIVPHIAAHMALLATLLPLHIVQQSVAHQQAFVRLQNVLQVIIWQVVSVLHVLLALTKQRLTPMALIHAKNALLALTMVLQAEQQLVLTNALKANILKKVQKPVQIVRLVPIRTKLANPHV